MFSQVRSSLARLEMWPKAYTDAFNLRKAEVRQRDEKERLTQKDFQSFVGGGQQGKRNPLEIQHDCKQCNASSGYQHFWRAPGLLAAAGHHSKWSTLWGCGQPYSGGVRAGC